MRFSRLCPSLTLLMLLGPALARPRCAQALPRLAQLFSAPTGVPARQARRSIGTARMASSPDGRPDPQTFAFGPHSIPAAHVFLTTARSFAFVNLKPVVPGHVLVSPRRCSQRLSGLQPEEVADLFALAARVSAAIEPHFSASSITLAVQDGPAAGQTVPHVHVHLLPRAGGDFARNDQVYDELEKQSNAPAGAPGEPSGLGAPFDPDAPRPARSHREMAEEAALLRILF